MVTELRLHGKETLAFRQALRRLATHLDVNRARCVPPNQVKFYLKECEKVMLILR